MAHRKFPDPEAVIYSALAESVSDGVLNCEPQVLSEATVAGSLCARETEKSELQDHQTGA